MRSAAVTQSSRASGSPRADTCACATPILAFASPQDGQAQMAKPKSTGVQAAHGIVHLSH